MSLATLLVFGAGIVLLSWGTALLVRGAAHLATMAVASPLVIGLTMAARAQTPPSWP